MAQEIKITGSFIWTFEDVKARQDALAPVGPRQRKVLFFFLIIISIAVMIVGRDIKSIFRSPSDLFLAAVPLILLVTMYPIIQYSQNENLKKGFLQSPDSNKNVEVFITSDEIVMKVLGVSEVKWDWKVIKEIKQNPKGFSFLLAERTGFWLPLRAFQSETDINAFLELAKRLVPKFKAST